MHLSPTTTLTLFEFDPWIRYPRSTKGSYNCTVQGLTLDQGNTKVSYRVSRPPTTLCTTSFVLPLQPFFFGSTRDSGITNRTKSKNQTNQGQQLTNKDSYSILDRQRYHTVHSILLGGAREGVRSHRIPPYRSFLVIGFRSLLFREQSKKKQNKPTYL